jgi:phospholipase C
VKNITALIVASFLMASCTPGTPAPTLTPPPTGPTQTPAPGPNGIKHVFVIEMENHGYTEVWDPAAAPHITSLGNQSVRATNYHSLIHPSLPNYLQMMSGDNSNITTDCSPKSSSCQVKTKNLADSLEAKGLTWKAYEESMPSPCDLTSSGTYEPKHNPFVYFDDIRTDPLRCAAHDVPYTVLAVDLSLAVTTPNFVFVTPDLCNDMHDCPVSTGDTWLKNNLPAILNSPACTSNKCLVILTWDEDDKSQSNHVLTIFAGSAARTGGATSDASYNHYSLLRTVEDIFGLPTLTSNDAAASPMTDMLR